MFELQYFIIGIIQGFTEFLPISSSGHLVLVSELNSWQDQGLFTDVAVHVGTLLAVIIYLRSHISILIKSFFSFQLSNNDNLIKIIIATIPAVIVGFFIFDFVQLYFRDINNSVKTINIKNIESEMKKKSEEFKKSGSNIYV